VSTCADTDKGDDIGSFPQQGMCSSTVMLSLMCATIQGGSGTGGQGHRCTAGGSGTGRIERRPSTVRKYDGIPPCMQTQCYVAKINRVAASGYGVPCTPHRQHHRHRRRGNDRVGRFRLLARAVNTATGMYMPQAAPGSGRPDTKPTPNRK
jgi:hypothetical protein